MLHVTCDVIDIAQYHILKSKIAAKYFTFCQNSVKTFLSQFAFEKVKHKEFE